MNNVSRILQQLARIVLKFVRLATSAFARLNPLPENIMERPRDTDSTIWHIAYANRIDADMIHVSPEEEEVERQLSGSATGADDWEDIEF